MNSIRAMFLVIASIVLLGVSSFAQSPTQIKKKCPNVSVYSIVSITSLGDINVQPCSGRTTIFTQNVSIPSTSTITAGGMTGNPNLAFTATAITSTTTGAQTFKGASYNFSNNAGTAEFEMSLVPSNAAGGFSVGDCTTTPTTCISMSQGAGVLALSATALDLAGTSVFAYNRTITAGGTTGAQTINKPAGTVNVAAGQASIVVTNNTVNITSIPFVTLRTADATCTFVKSAVPTANTLTITLDANCTAETSVGFLITN